MAQAKTDWCFVEYPLCFALVLFLLMAPIPGRWSSKQTGFSLAGAMLLCGWVWGRSSATLAELDQLERADAKVQQEEAEQIAAQEQLEQKLAALEQQRQRLLQEHQDKELQLAQLLQAERQAITKEAQQRIQQAYQLLEAKTREVAALHQATLDIKAELERQPTREQIEAEGLQRHLNMLRIGQQIGKAEEEANAELERVRIEKEVRLNAYRQRLEQQYGLAGSGQPSRQGHPLSSPSTQAQAMSPAIDVSAHSGANAFTEDDPFDPGWNTSSASQDPDLEEFKI